jgi:hypothetical protein
MAVKKEGKMKEQMAASCQLRHISRDTYPVIVALHCYTTGLDLAYQVNLKTRAP